jgi:23S rRNA (pseudouridine1915-N3)-methyltransferase
MKIRLIVIGKTEEDYLKRGISLYLDRIIRYVPFEYIELPALKNAASLSLAEQQSREQDIFKKQIRNDETIILLDETGEQMRSKDFANYLNLRMISGIKSITFMVGGPYGFSQYMRKRAGKLISLSRMTFSHQMVRLIFAEQMYRAFTIIRNEPYHHE